MMVVEKDDLGLGLGLSLSLSFSNDHLNNSSSSYNNFSSPPPLMTPFSFIRSSPSWAQSVPFSDGEAGCGAGRRKADFLKVGIDVNCSPEEMAAEDVGGACSPNSTISSTSGKRSTGEEEYRCQAGGDRERACSRGTSEVEDEDAGDNNNSQNNSNKKLRLSKDQAAVLEETFKDHNTLNPKQKASLAKRLGLRPRQVEVWFQNRRARTKLKQTEVDCEYLRRCCEALTDENRRLQKEVHQLRALKLGPQLYMPPMPPTTLTMCPSCKRTVQPVAPPMDRPWGPARGSQNPHQL